MVTSPAPLSDFDLDVKVIQLIRLRQDLSRADQLRLLQENLEIAPVALQASLDRLYALSSF